MTDKKQIEDWWNETLKEQKSYMGSGHDLIGKLNTKFSACSDQEKELFSDILTSIAESKDEEFVFALVVLENYCKGESLDKVYNKTKTFDTHDDDIIHYLRVIGQQGKSERKDILEEFLLCPELNPNHSSVQWQTFPNFKDVFAKAYSNYLVETNYDEWKVSAIVSAFMDSPEALIELKNVLENQNSSV